MDPISLTASLIAVVQATSKIISICYDYRSSAKSASREIIQITDELNALKGVLESLLRVVEQAEVNGRGEETLSTFKLLVKDGKALETCQQELERLKSKLEPEKGWRKVRKVLIWPLQEGETKRALEGLERLKATMLVALSTDQASLSLSIKDDVGYLTQMFRSHATDEKRQAIHKWLTGPDPSTNYAANKKKRQQNTGIWLLTSKAYEDWLQRSQSFLWLYGIPGSGKSVLSSTVVEHLLRISQQEPAIGVAYFYFDFNGAGKRSVGAAIRSLIQQLVAQCESVPSPLLSLYQSHGNGSRNVEMPALLAIFQNILLTFHNTYLVFDALDESTECEDVLEFLHKIRSWDLSRVHILVTSRQLPIIEESMDELATGRICLQDSGLNQDIVIYITDKLENDKVLKQWPPEIRFQIQKNLLNQEEGMFQWVVCQFDMLQRCMSVKAIRNAMSQLPKSLDETYDRILLGIDEVNQADVMKILKTLTVSRDNLTSKEIVEVLAVDINSDPPKFDIDSRLIDPRNILSMCSSLVKFSGDGHRRPKFTAPLDSFRYSLEGDDWGRPQEPTLRLAHASVAEYLTRAKPSGPSQFHFTISEACQFMAQTCLTYLLNPEFAAGDDDISHVMIQKRLQKYPFLEHCAECLRLYLKQRPGDPRNHLSPRTKELLRMFFDTCKLPKGGHFAAWVRILIPDSPAAYVQNTSPLYYAASFGLLEVVRILLDTEEGIDLNALGGRAHSTALHVSVFRNHLEVARLLLERGADPNISNCFGESTLFFAYVNQNKEMEKLLADHGAVRRKKALGK